MKGRNTFTNSEILTIKKLISEKVVATPEKQKGIRGKIRKIGFHYSDFSSKKDGYTVSDFEALIRSGQIKISDSSYKPEANETTKVMAKSVKVEKQIAEIQKTKDLRSNLDTFKINRFDPKTDSETNIANSSGNYILCLKENSNLPIASIKPILTSFEGLQVIYTGIASGSLRTRDFRQHFKGNNAGRSTLRKSLGVLFGYKQIPRDSDPTTGKTKFNIKDEQKLSEWMCNNLVMYFLPTSDFDNIEIELINHFNPPLNLKHNSNIVNLDFRRILSSLRAKNIESRKGKYNSR
ncbi:GIY-YIG nuclease family protein [Flavobacterium selenitireducens]|uniref:GIY-YIG nuclease family protein n=1 Tax=Flavobacterium selenitireducens TaxID=2722704 RepID=UPI00168BA2D8|nr:hypothetical protein [Flavobacterium selenitireducens]MBD3581577.1 hypothetical protein [Flavobacterium selenitireducens]